MEEKTETIKTEPKPKYSKKNILRNTFVVLLALLLGYIHYRYVSHLFENDRNFSYLSKLEREMSFRTEMGFYYSYYKTVVEEQQFLVGISKLLYDRRVEYPKEVNAFNRFNIHPEVIIGTVYRYFEPWLNGTRQCHTVDRGEGLPAVESCVGIGEPIFFYLEAIWWLAGLTVAAVFLYATALSESVLGGAMAVAQYFANHAECTRVQWAPNERENFAMPLLLLQAWLVSAQLRGRGRRATFQLQVAIFILNCFCLLFWQFTQFIFLTQIAIFFIMEQLRIIDLKTLCIFLHSHFCGLHMAVLLLQGNDMLKSSYYTSFFISVSTYCLLFSYLRIKAVNRWELLAEFWLTTLRIAAVICGSFCLKKLISDFLKVDEDSHVWDILYSKLTNYKSFHTLIYTCSDVFDFLPMSTMKKLFLTSLIPFVLFNSVMAVKEWIVQSLTDYRNSKIKKDDKKVNETEKDGNTQEDTDDSGIENNSEVKIDNKAANATDKKKAKAEADKRKVINSDDELVCFLWHLKIDAAVFYNISQMAVYAVMAILVMRLKLLFVTQMCIVSSLFAKYCWFPKPAARYAPLLWMLCLLPLVRRLFLNVSQEMSHIGEFSDIELERLLEWIARDTSAGAAFAGSMPVLAAVMVATRRPVVAHPHYEHYEARQRAYSVYKTYGKFPPLELYQELNQLKATYLIVEAKYCYGRSSKGCSFEDIWDVEVPSLARRPRLCHTLLTEPTEHLYPAYRSRQYAVFRIHDYSVRYMPRSFDT